MNTVTSKNPHGPLELEGLIEFEPAADGIRMMLQSSKGSAVHMNPAGWKV